MRALKFILSLLVSSFSCFVGSYLVARLLVHSRNGFGAGDLHAFVIFTAAFAVLLLLPAGIFAMVVRNARLVNRVGLAIFLGAFAGFGWTLLNRWYLGPWFGAWSFPVLYCWIIGGAVGMLTVAMVGLAKGKASGPIDDAP